MMFGLTTTDLGPKGRRAGLDLMRLLLAIFVVICHCALPNSFGLVAEFAFNNGIGRIIVPFFFMMTGYYFADLTQDGLMPWFKRVTWIYLAWLALYLPNMLLYQPPNPFRLLLQATFGYYHLWFMSALIGGGVLLYLFRNLPDRHLKGLAVSAVFVGAVMQYGLNWLLEWPGGFARYDLVVLTRNFLFIGFPYMALGLLLARSPARVEIPLEQANKVLLVSLGFLAVESYVNYRLFSAGGFFDIYVSALVAGPALFIWALALPIWVEGRRLRDLAAIIYFSHLLFVLPLQVHFGLSPLALTIASLALCFATAPIFVRAARYVPLL